MAALRVKLPDVVSILDVDEPEPTLMFAASIPPLASILPPKVPPPATSRAPLISALPLEVNLPVTSKFASTLVLPVMLTTLLTLSGPSN